MALILWATVFLRCRRHGGELAGFEQFLTKNSSSTSQGFGDISPETAGGKIFTMFYIVIGLGVFVTAAALDRRRCDPFPIQGGQGKGADIQGVNACLG